MAYRADSTLQAEFERQAAATPAAVAVREADAEVSYAQLNVRANRLAHFLRAQGVGRETLVGLCAERSLSQLVGLLAVLKAGAAYVPLDPTQPEARLDEVIAEAGIGWVLCQEELLEQFGFEGCTRVPLEGVLATRLYGEAADANPAASVDGSDLAYVLYTSGSTGRPKGVEVTHAAVLDYCGGAHARYYDSGLSGAYLLTSLGFDLSLPGV